MTLKAQLSSGAKWLVILLAGIVLLGPGVVSPAAKAPQQKCSTCVRCECCVKQLPSDSTPPLAPPASARSSIQKNFQVLFTLSVLFGPPRESREDAAVHLPSVSCAASAPLYQRHCAYLI